MNTAEWPGVYELNRRLHFDVCRTYRMTTRDCDRRVPAEHSGWEFLASRSGKFNFAVGSREYALSPGHALLFNASEPHEERHARETPSCTDGIVFSSEWLDRLVGEIGIDADRLVFEEPMLEVGPETRRLLDRLFSIRDLPEASQASFDCVSSELAIHLLLERRHNFTSTIRNAASRDCRFALLRSKRAISDLLESEKIDLGEIARRFGVSKFHFVRRFKSVTGITPIRYVNLLRSDRVKEKLLDTDLSITRIALDARYEDLSTFNKSFRKLNGCSPSVYRAKGR